MFVLVLSFLKDYTINQIQQALDVLILKERKETPKTSKELKASSSILDEVAKIAAEASDELKAKVRYSTENFKKF
jgi:hypothetical protein